MKKFALALLLIALPAFADAAPSLQDNMKSIGTLFKAIVTTMDDRTQNATNATNADKIQALFVAVSNQVPDSINQLSPDQKPAALADFKRLIGEETQFAQSLKAAFLANDNTTAANIVNKMNLDKKEGHTKYAQD
jgi:hypothetical protein